MPVPLSISQKHLAIFPSLAGAGLSHTEALWDRITASEHFPAHNDSAFYEVRVEKLVNSETEIPKTQEDLHLAMFRLACAWPFCGGPPLATEQPIASPSSTSETNADTVREKLLAERGLQAVAVAHVGNYEVVIQYEKPVLLTAAKIANAMHNSQVLDSLLRYYHSAWLERYYHNRGDASGWFAHLYNVRDLLDQTFGSAKSARTALEIPRSLWSDFGDKLNNGLRHAMPDGSMVELTRTEIEKLFSDAKTLVNACLRRERLI